MQWDPRHCHGVLALLFGADCPCSHAIRLHLHALLTLPPSDGYIAIASVVVGRLGLPLVGVALSLLGDGQLPLLLFVVVEVGQTPQELVRIALNRVGCCGDWSFSCDGGGCRRLHYYHVKDQWITLERG